MNKHLMKSIVKLSSLWVLFITGILVSCKEEGTPPTVETAPITEVTAFSAVCGGTVTNEGSSPVIARGVCWAAKLDPTINDIKTENGGGAGSFTSQIAGLYAGISYFVRAYATNSAGTSYGITKSFVAEGKTPSVSVSSATNISSTSVTLNGHVTSNSAVTTASFQYGTTTAYTNSITASQSPLSPAESIDVSADLPGLKPATLYHYRVVASNSLGTSFSSDITFTTAASKSGK
jgi:hypothetical protein